MKYKVTAFGYFSDESVTVDAESSSKAKYAAYKAEAVKMDGGAKNG